MRTILVSQLRPKDLELRVIHLYLISHSGPWTDEMNFGTFWRHSECYGDLNKLEAGCIIFKASSLAQERDYSRKLNLFHLGVK